MGTEGTATAERTVEQTDLSPQLKILEEKGIGRVIKDPQSSIVGHMICPKLEPGLPLPIYDIALTGVHGEVQILDSAWPTTTFPAPVEDSNIGLATQPITAA